MTTDELTTQFVTCQGELKSFLLRMTASVQDAEDIVQDTYLKAQSKIETFRGRFAMYIPPLMEELGLAEVEHNAHNRWVRAK